MTGQRLVGNHQKLPIATPHETCYTTRRTVWHNCEGDANLASLLNDQGAVSVFKPTRLTFDEWSERLHEVEERFGDSTIEFYRRYASGKLGDDDDRMMWAGLYRLYLKSLPLRADRTGFRRE